MKRNTPCRQIIALGFMVMFFTGFTAFIGRYGPPFYSGDDHHFFEQLIYRTHRQLAERFTFQLASRRRR